MQTIKLTGIEIFELSQFAGIIQNKEVDSDIAETEFMIVQDICGISVEEDDNSYKKYKTLAFLSEYPEEGGLPIGDEIIKELPETRAEARKTDSTHYFTGRPCKHNHISKRITSTGNCAECLHIARRIARLKTPHAPYSEKEKKYSKFYLRRINEKTQDNAHNKCQPWTLKDLKYILERNEKGNYKRTATQAAHKLNRSYSGVLNARRNYKEGGRYEKSNL